MHRALATTACLAILVLSGSCGGDDPIGGVPDHIVTIERANGIAKRLDVWVADDDSERAKGLMGVTQLASKRGMAFLFDGPSIESFWMKDTLIPLSVAFVDAAGSIASIQDMEPCHSDPCPTYSSVAPCVMAIEANRGWFEDNGVRIGDSARLNTGASA